MYQEDWLDRVNAPYLELAKRKQAGYLPDFVGQFEEVPERGFWDAAVAGAKAQAAGTVASQAEAFNIMGIGDGATANALNQVAQENARRREYTWQDMVNDPMKYIADPEGLTYDLAGGLASTAVFMGETAALGGVGGVAARATGLANKIGGTARLIQGVKTVAEANNMPWLSKIMESPAGKMLVLNVMKTPLESLSIAGSAGSAVGREGGSLEEQRSAALQAGALNTVVGAFTNTLESAGLGKLIAKEGGKDLFTKKVASVVSAAADGASKPNFVQKIRQYELNKGALANYGKSAVALTSNALLNAYEEGAQETIEQYTQGKKSDITDIINPFAWDDEALTSAAIGGVTGAGQGAVMTGVGKGLNTLFGVDEQSDKKAKDFKPTTATKEESKVVKDSLTSQPQPLTAEQQELAQAQSESYDEAFGVDEESVRDFEEKQSQKLSETVGSGVDEETAEAEYQRRNELMQLALGMDIPQFVGTKTKEQAKQSPQSPVKAKNWNKVNKGTNISIPQKELPTPTFERTPQNYVGSYTTQGIEKAINQSDNKLKELAHKIQHFDDSDRLKINVFRELRRRGITLGENFSIDADESQIIPYGSTELSTEQSQGFQKAEAPATVTQVPRERVQQAIDKYIGQPQMFKQHINDLISFVGKAVAENRISKDEAKVAVAQIKAFHDEVATAIGGTIRQYSKNTPPKSKAQNAKASYLALPEATQKAIEESPEQAEEIFAQEAKEYIASSIDTIADLSERKKEARLQRDNAHELLRELLKPAIDVLNAGRNNGYTLVPGNQDNGRMVRMSNNDLWYQEFRKEQQHKPLVPEIEELAYQLLIDKFPYTKPDAYAFDIAAEDMEEYENEMRELKQQLDYARAYYFALDETYKNILEESKKADKENQKTTQETKKEVKKDGESQNQQTDSEAEKSADDGNTTPKQIENQQEENEVISNPAPKLTKAQKEIVDYIKKQINIDLTPFVDNFFKAKKGQINIAINKMGKNDIQQLKSFILKTQGGYGNYQLQVEDLGNWGITIKFAKRKDGNKSPIKYSAEELDKKFQVAYHGSPHIFNEFNLENIGTGEGAQAHGWGLYFAKNKEVAKSYRERLSDTLVEYDGEDINILFKELIRKGEYGKAAIVEEAMTSSVEELRENKDQYIEDEIFSEKDYEWFEKQIAPKVKASGSLFEVDVPEDDVLLDEDMSFDEQPEKVKEAIHNILGEGKMLSEQEFLEGLDLQGIREAVGFFTEAHLDFETSYLYDELKEDLWTLASELYNSGNVQEAKNAITEKLKEQLDLWVEENGIDADVNFTIDTILEMIGNEIIRELIDYQNKDYSQMNGSQLYDKIADIAGGHKQASLLLNENGVKGIVYDGAQDGRCYVIFDDEAIAIKRRYDTAIAEHKEKIQQAADKQKALLKDALKGGKFEIQDNGDYKVTMPNGVVIYASVKDQIIINPLEMQGAKAAHGLKGDAISILGSFQKITSDGIDALINLSASTAKDTTAYHEATHALIELALTEKQKQLIFNTLEPMAQEAGKDLEEFVCDYVAAWRLKRKNANMFGKLWQKIFDIAKRLQAWFTQTENLHNLLRKIENGEVWKQTAEMQAKEYSPANNKYFATDLAKRFQEFLHNEQDVFESEQYKKYNQARAEASNQHDVLWKEYKNLDEKLKSLTPSFDSEEAQELIKEFDIDIDSYSGRRILEMFLQNDAKSQNKELKKQIDEKWKQLRQLSYEERKNRIFAKRIVDKASRQLRKKHFFTEPPKPTNQSEFEGFTIETTGMSGYDDVLEQIDVDKKGYRYTRNSKYGLAYIAEMSPLEYMDRCALEIFKKTYHSNLYGTLVSDGDVDKYADMMKNGTKFDLPMLNYNNMQQEGRHRALAAYLNGIEKIPVLVIGQPEYNLMSTKYSAEESIPKTATARVGAAWKSSKPQTFWEQVKSDGFFKALWNKFYTDWVDKLKPLEALDVINAQYLGRELKQDEKIREKAQNVSYNSAGIAHSLLDGNANDIAAVNAMLKNKKLPHEATLQMVLDEIKPSDMNDKYGKNWLKENGFDHWFEALSNYLLGRRLREMWYRRKDEFDEQVRMREEAVAQLDEETQEKIKEWDNKVLEWERNGKEGNKPRKPKDLIIAYASADGFVDVTKLPLWSEWEYALPQNISIQTVEQMIKESPKEFAKAADIYYKLNDNLLTILEDAGIISQETHEKLNGKYKEYCPLMRDFSDTAGADEFIEGLTSGGKSLANVAVPLHKIKAEGSERLVSSPLESTINAVAVFTQRAERNKVAQLAVEMTQKSGATNLLMEMPYGTKPRANESTFSVLFDGKKKVYQCEPSMYGAIAGYNIPAASMVFKVASTAANVLRVGATSSPSFILRNLIRDTMFAGISSKNGFVPIYDTIRGWNELRKNTAYATEFHAAGVDQFSFYGNGESRYKKLTEMTKEDNYGFLDPRTWLKAFREYSELAEASTRMGEYLRAREQGKEIRLAAEDARNITLNFTRSGVRGEQVNKVIPFFNAVIQGGDKMVDMFRKDFVGTSVRTFEYIILPSIALWCLNHDEDWYKKLNPEIKNQYWCFGKNLKVPKPQEMGVLFGSGSEAILDTAYDIDPKAVENWSKQFVGNIAPSFIPTILLPIVEWQANYNFFRNKEVVSKKLQRLPDELQYNDSTSGISKAIGSVAKISPAKIDNLVGSATGTMGMLFYSGLGLPLDGKQNVPAKHWYELPFFRDFAVTDYNLNRNVNDFYDIYNKSEKQHTGYGKKGSPSVATKTIRNAYKAISDINKDVQKIQNSRQIKPERKRLLIDRKRQQIERIAEKIVRKYGEHYL